MKHFALNHKGKLITLSLFILLIVALPYVVKSVIISNIEKQGFDDVTIEAISLNIFKGSIEIEHVNLRHNGKEKLAVGLMRADYRWQGIFSGGIATELIELRDTNLAIIEDEEGNLEVVIPIVNNKAAEENSDTAQAIAFPKLDVDLIRFSNISVDIQLAKLKSKLNIEEFTLTRLSTWHDYPAELVVKAKFNQAVIDINLQAKPLASTPTAKGTIAITNLQLADFKQYIPKQFSQFSGLFNAKLNYDGSRLSKQQVIMKVDGTVALEQLKAQYLPLGLSANSLQVQLSSDIDMNGSDLSYIVNADSTLSAFKSFDTQQDYSLFDFDTLELTNLSVDEKTNLAFDSLKINDLNALALKGTKEKDKHLAYFKQVQLTNMKLNLMDNELSLDQIILSELTSILKLENDYKIAEITSLNEFLSTLNENEQPPASTENNITEDDAENAQKPPFSIRLNQLDLSKGSVIHVAQETAERKFRRDIFIDELNVQQLSPSDPSNESKFTLKAKVGEFTSIDINGGGKLFAPLPSIKASGHIDEISLARISPFVETVIGYQFLSGQLDHEFDLAIENNIIDMNNVLVIRKIEIEEVGQDKNTLSDLMPLPMAISMLENSDRTIDLEVPVKGDLSSSEVGLQPMIQMALSKALQTGSLAFLKHTLQPYSTVVFAAEYLIDESNNVNFEPMPFPVNAVELSAEQQAYADKLVGLLIQREQINLSLCGFSNAKDKEQISLTPIATPATTLSVPTATSGSSAPSTVDEKGINQLLTELASDRAKAVKRYFISKNIKSKRLFLCKAKYQDDELSGVKISM